MFANRTIEFDTLGFSAGADFNTLATAPPWAFGGWSKGGVNQPSDAAPVKLVGLGELGQDQASPAGGTDFTTWVIAIGAGTLLYLMFFYGGGPKYSLYSDFRRTAKGERRSLTGTRTTAKRPRRAKR